MNAHELKALQGQLAKAKADEKVKKEAHIAATRELQVAHARTQSLQKQLDNAVKEPMVTEHALLRYIERVYKVDLEELKKQILTPTLVSAIKTLGSGKYPLEGGGKAVVQGLNVVSITD